jgi:bifunctional non-homologous end joining protein LigD
MALKDYASKRSFERTPEPGPGAGPKTDHLRFVVHKHAARNLHYDLRLELDGVLKSWALPKGPTLDPSRRRLAVMVEDHPLEYREFEGLIPEGNYGAGSVIIWDRGIYRHPSGSEQESEPLLREGLRKGDLKFILAGEKLRGEFALVRTGRDGRSWLLLKKKDRYAATGEVLGANRSVASSRSLEEVLEEAGAGPFRQRKRQQIRLQEALESEDLQAAPERPMPSGVSPMLAATDRESFDDPDWVFEVKWDGYRAIAEVREGGVALYSRNGIPFNERYAPVADALRKLGAEAVLDGEIVVVDDRGRPDFQALQHYPVPGRGQLVYYVFDLPWLGGHDLTGLPLKKRKALLAKVLPAGPHLRYSGHVERDGVLFGRTVREKGLEGIMAKDGRSLYEPGRRSRSWLKLKTRLTQEAVIAGFTAPGRGRQFFGALVLGMFVGDELRYLGRVGGGFSAESLKAVREALDPLVQEACPFAETPEDSAAVTWVRPEKVCEVALAGWTDEGIMRQPVFLRMREDKRPREAVLEGLTRGNGETGTRRRNDDEKVRG